MTRRLTIPHVNRDANLRLVAAAIDLLHAANATSAAVRACEARIKAADDDREGIRSGLSGGTHGSGVSDPVFVAALPGINGYCDDVRARLDREQLRDDIGAIWTTARDMRNMVRRLASPHHEGQALCDGRNYSGFDIPWTPHSRDPRNGWGDPTCREGAGRSKLCPACLVRMNRWRTEHDLERISDAEERAA